MHLSTVVNRPYFSGNSHADFVITSLPPPNTPHSERSSPAGDFVPWVIMEHFSVTIADEVCKQQDLTLRKDAMLVDSSDLRKV